MKALTQISLTLVVCAGLAVSVEGASAQQGCGICVYGQGAHWALGDESIIKDYTEGHGWHFWTWSGNCLPHGICVGGDDVDAEELIEQVATAGRTGNTAELRRLSNMKGVVVNWHRRAIQVVACDGATVVAHVPVTEEVMSSLPRSAVVAEFASSQPRR